ncbi:hypothetical protein N7492_009510 [Penicillium capsulatum]|uniref:Uncharacterized protein n=1 Tax=Penicillium capsulatum TaxID=69766 RepID=A0A9W9HSX5_9EURO|nr:hypothetical protein N7492_009510 [Penicillium capsulatum]KAJ6106900.1 hypothetical protein N7512_010417 [Penicillium capsulatum]
MDPESYGMMDTAEDGPSGPRAEYPESLLAQVRAACQIPAIQGQVFIAIHECCEPLGSHDFMILGIYSTLNSANSAALDLFKREYEFFFACNHHMSRWVERRPHAPHIPCSLDEWESGGVYDDGKPGNTVLWEVHNGAVSLRALVGDEGDAYHVYVERYTVQ